LDKQFASQNYKKKKKKKKKKPFPKHPAEETSSRKRARESRIEYMRNLPFGSASEREGVSEH
jgi:hypothetical protein